MKPYGSIACIVFALLGACATQPKEPPRIMMQGFSISTPPVNPMEKQKSWIVATQGADLTVIGKQGRFSGESFTMQAMIVKLPAFNSADALVRYVESTERKELDPKRYRLMKLEVVRQRMHAQDCALSRVDAAERAPSEGTGSPVNVMVETMTLICPHPQDPLRGISMAYSHRHYPEDVDPQFAQDGASLMQTLAFEPL
jgi:hypothetical protein